MTRLGLRRPHAAIVLGVWAALAALGAPVCAEAQAPAAAPAPPVLRWGGDPEGGLPFVGADPAVPDRVTGFDVDLAAAIAHGLGRAPQFVSVQFQSIDASVRRGDFEIGLCGLEDTPGRRASLAVTVPYYEFTEVLTVRAADAARLRTLADLRGRRVATLGGTIAYEILLDAERAHGLSAVSYDDDVHPYEDLLNGRVDAVLLDHVLADKAVRRHPGLSTQPGAVAVGHYVGVLAPGNDALRDQVDTILRAAMRDGTLERIFRRWHVWNDDQARLYARILAAPADAPAATGAQADSAAAGEAAGQPGSRLDAVIRYLPAILRAALVTVVLSCAAMVLAVVMGIALASGRVYGGRLLRGACTAYVEVTRGTPVLLQLFVLYYGLAEVVRLPAFVAALLGLGLNYAAYESEIYRAALEAVPTGQLDAARILGLSERQVFTLVRGPQALRLALAPMTNDFVALLKDSSLVSVLTVVELTKQTAIFAANIGSWVVPGALCAALYLAMSLPLSRLARRLEATWKAPTV
jgi:polar amino acid transport system substrate-binding protein